MSERIHRYVAEARHLATSHPESALGMARKAAEAVCREVYAKHIGPAGPRATLDDFITKLTASTALPRRIQVPLRTIQAYGNHAAHDQGEQAAIDGHYIQPALQALDTVVQWFVDDFASAAVSADESSAKVAPATPLQSPQHEENTDLAEVVRLEPLHGREEELRLLCDGLDTLAGSTQSGRAVLLGGATGAGKTAVAERALAHAGSKRFRIVRATCGLLHEGMSFYPVRELLRQMTSAHGVAADVALAFGPQSSQHTIARLVEQPDAEPTARRDALIATFTNVVFARIAHDKMPLVVFIDDLERIDKGSVDALICLVARAREGPVMLLGAYRSDVVAVAGASNHPLRPLISALRRDSARTHVLELGPLSRETMGPLVTTLLGGPCDLPTSFVRRLFEETEGNPLYVREALRTLSSKRHDADEPPLRQVQGTWRLVREADTWEIPRSIEDAIASRLVSLSEFDRTVIEHAAVIGKRFRFEILLELGLGTEDALIQSLEHHLSADLVRELRNTDNVFEFSHGKIREVLYSAITGIRRARMHGQVADVLVRNVGTVSADEHDVLVGGHLFAARRYAAAAPYLLRAGERALALQAASDAALQFKRALEALEKIPDTPRPTLDRTRLLLGSSLKASSEFVAAEAQFLTIVREGSDDYAKRWSLNHLGDISLVQGRVNEAIDRYQQCEALARQHGDTELVAETAADLAELHMRQAEQLAGVDAARAAEHNTLYNRYLDLEQELAPTVGQPAALARAYRNSAKRARARGDLSVAIALYEQSIEYADAGVDSHQFLIPYAKALRLVGRHADAMGIVRRVLEWSRQIGARRSEAIARQYLGLLLMEMNLASPERNLTEAIGEMSRALLLHQEVWFEQGRRETEVDLAEAAAHGGDREALQQHLARAVSESHAISDVNMAHAVLSQLRANGETQRATRFAGALETMGLLVESAGDRQRVQPPEETEAV